LPTDAQPGIGLVPDRRRPEGTPQRRASSIRWTHGLINRGVICGDIILSLASTGVGWLASPEPPPLTWLQALAVALIMTVVFVRIGSSDTPRCARRSSI